LFLETSLRPDLRLVAVYLENTVITISLVFLLQFACHFPAIHPVPDAPGDNFFLRRKEMDK